MDCSIDNNSDINSQYDAAMQVCNVNVCGEIFQYLFDSCPHHALTEVVCGGGQHIWSIA